MHKCVNPWARSADVLIAWITQRDRNGNYSNWMRYKGATKTKTGVNKRIIADEISMLLRQHGFHRHGVAVIDKISRIVALFNRAKDWERNTGHGLTQKGLGEDGVDEDNPEHLELISQNEKTIQDARLKLCKYYNELAIVLEDKPLAKPVYHSSTGDAVDYESDESMENPINNTQSTDYEAELYRHHGSPLDKNVTTMANL
ncbi:hypothetical protein AC1031_004049 [Aphanomyces cochlioides]|nr:hypothetical protein AC1031_004049 [Aphanomyces cochlioides]